MIKWLKRKLRSWLLEEQEQPAPSNQIQAWVPGSPPTLETFSITGAIGLSLVGVHPTGRRLIQQAEALDQDQWLAFWKKHTPDHAGWTWEDGTPFCR